MPKVYKRQEAFSLKELAAMWNLSQASMRRLIATEKFPNRPLRAMRFGPGKASRITRMSVEKYLQEIGALPEGQSLPDDYGMDIIYEEGESA